MAAMWGRGGGGGRGGGPVWFAKRYVPRAAASMDGVVPEVPHDRAVVRAERATCASLSVRMGSGRERKHTHNHSPTSPTDDASADPFIEGDPYRTLFLGRLAPTTTEGTRGRGLETCRPLG
jgi:hypothetical protein